MSVKQLTSKSCRSKYAGLKYNFLRWAPGRTGTSCWCALSAVSTTRTSSSGNLSPRIEPAEKSPSDCSRYTQCGWTIADVICWKKMPEQYWLINLPREVPRIVFTICEKNESHLCTEFFNFERTIGVFTIKQRHCHYNFFFHKLSHLKTGTST